MHAMFKKVIFAFILTLAVLTTGAWQSNPVASAEKQQQNTPELPLYSGLTWKNSGLTDRTITLNTKGDAIFLSGETYQAEQQFATGLPQDVLDYYSNEKLAQAGWSSYDAVDLAGGVRKVFYHEAGVYLSIESQICSDGGASTCITVWKSEQVDVKTLTPSDTSEPEPLATGSFGKISPANGVSNVSPASVVLSWGTFSPTPDKYSYCIKAGSECAANDPNWTGTFTNTSVTITNLAYGKTYYWQVKAIACADCDPKIFYYADGGTWWKFNTKLNGVSIVGNAGVGGATLSYFDVSNKTVTADSLGNYSILLPVDWSGTVTPSKTGYSFTPPSTTYPALSVSQTITNYTATLFSYSISGNAGLSGATLSYVDGTAKTVTADAAGNYVISVPYNWSGTVTPSKVGYTFLPVNRSYTNVLANQPAQNYLATQITYTISGNAGAAGVTLNYVDSVAKTAISDSIGNYSITIPHGWSGTITPVKVPYFFTPVAGVTGTYTTVGANFTGQNYTISIFKDVVSSYWAFNFIERFYLSGITTGCSVSPLNYCPENTVTRAQMAIFLVRAKHGIAFVPPVATGVFADVPVGSFGADYIEQLAADGITGGCGGGNFCPNQIVSRSQMAIFLVRAKHGAAFVPPTAIGIFTDVPVGSFGADYIEQMVADGVTSGCTANTFCPSNSVSRAQMAVFMVKAFNLP